MALSLAATMRANLARFRGDLERFLARGQQARDAVALSTASGYELVAFRCMTLLARVHVLQGQLRGAATVYEQAGQATPGTLWPCRSGTRAARSREVRPGDGDPGGVCASG
jgi:hypothetical protein